MRETVRCVTGRVGAFLSLFVLLACAVPAGRAQAVVCARGSEDLLTLPDNGYVGWWNGSSAVCIGPRQVVSAAHVGGEVGGVFWMRGNSYHAVSIRRHSSQDVQVIELAEPLPGYHRFADGVRAGDRGVLGGFGRTAGNQLADGYDWSGAQAEAWGENTIDNAAWLIVVSFTNPADPSAVPHESTFAGNDSGGGLFVRLASGELRLAGIAVGVTGIGESQYGGLASCLNVEAFRSWVEGCRADFNRSGAVTAEDLFDFVESWSIHSESADLNRDVAVTFEDMLLFIRAYLVGC